MTRPKRRRRTSDLLHHVQEEETEREADSGDRRARRGRTSADLELVEHGLQARFDVVPSAKRQLPGLVRSSLTASIPTAATGASSSRRASIASSSGDVRAERPRAKRRRARQLRAADLTEHAVQRTCAELALALARQLRDTPSIARLEAVAESSRRPRPGRGGARARRADERSLPCLEGRTAPCQCGLKPAGRRLKGSSRFGRIDQPVARSRLGEHVARMRRDPARSSRAGARRTRAGSAPRPGTPAPTPRAAACGA